MIKLYNLKKIKFEKEYNDYRDYIFIAIIFISLSLSFIVFSDSYYRLLESIMDMFKSILIWICSMFRIKLVITNTINEISNIDSFNSIINYNYDIKSFQYSIRILFKEIFKLDNLVLFLRSNVNILKTLLIIITLIIPLIYLFKYIIQQYIYQFNNEYNEDTIHLLRFKWIEDNVFKPIYNWLSEFYYYSKSKKNIVIFILLVWSCNLNITSIIISIIAFYMYFCATFEIEMIIIQIYKLICDLTFVIKYVPSILYLIIVIYIFEKWRRNIANSRLEHYENRNKGFINSLALSDMIVGTMGSKKTTTLTDMALSQEVIFRDKALDMLVEIYIQFPYFPWFKFENYIKDKMRKHYIYNLASAKRTIKNYIKIYNKQFDLKDNDLEQYIKKYSYFGNNLLFDYDTKKYKLTYNNKLKEISIFDSLEVYAQLYFIYIINSTLLYSNYSIRVDNEKIDNGNFPIWNNSFFNKESDVYSRYAKIIDFDTMRICQTIIKNNKNIGFLEFGVVVITEVGKERGNSLENQEMKKKSIETNQKNDGFNKWLKMIRHAATVNNYPFIKVLMDEQRPESLGADARELCDILDIYSTSDKMLTYPFYVIERKIHDLIYNKYNSFIVNIRHCRADNTLFMYILDKFVYYVHKRNITLFNLYGYYINIIKKEKGIIEKELTKHKYYLSFQKIYKERFATDAYADNFNQKSLKCKFGYDDIKSYAGIRATIEELRQQNSYFITEIDEGNKDEI